MIGFLPGRLLPAKLRRSVGDAASLVQRITLPVLLAVCLAALSIPVTDAMAQERVERRSIMQMLFGPTRQAAPPRYYEPQRAAPPPRERRPQQVQPRRSQQQAPARTTPRRQAAPAAPPPPPAVEKAEDARKVLVVGDFMAAGLVEGLEAAFADAADVVIIQESNGSSGLVRDDYHDWPNTLPGILDSVEPDILVVMLGSNDRQQMVVDGNREAVRSDAWTAAYQSRVAALAKAATDRSVPLVWVGAPAFQSPSMSTDILAINEIYRDHTATIGADFVDIWDGFVDEAGAFIFTGSDIRGQQVRLRGSDGINMTAAGKRKVAFYAERPIRRLLGASPQQDGSDTQDDSATPAIVDGGPIGPPMPQTPRQIVRTLPMSIDDPAFDGGDTLLGSPRAVVAVSALPTPRDRLVSEGIGAEAPEGRADYFRISPPTETPSAPVPTDASPSAEDAEEPLRPSISMDTSTSSDAIAAIIEAEGAL